MRDVRNISVKEIDKFPYLMEFINESHNKYKNVTIYVILKSSKVLPRLVTRSFPLN